MKYKLKNFLENLTEFLGLQPKRCSDRPRQVDFQKNISIYNLII